MKRALLLFLVLSCICHTNAQFFEGFEGTTLPDQPTGQWLLTTGAWHVADNGLGIGQFWTPNEAVTMPPSQYEGSRAAYINRENIGMGNTSEDWLVTPAVTIGPDQALVFFSRTTLLGNQGTEFEIRLSTTSQTDQSSFIPIESWNEDEVSEVFNIYDQKVVPLANWAGQTVYIAFVRKYTQPEVTLSGDRWLIDAVSIIAAPEINNVHGYAGVNDGVLCNPNPISNLRINVNNGTTTYFKYTSDGNYNINFEGQDVSVTPGAFNPEWFTVSPPSYNISFTNGDNSETANFCFDPTASAQHDVGIVIIPQQQPRPGFNVSYVLVITNHGAFVENGEVNFTFNDNVLDFVGSSETATVNPNDISWSFSNLPIFGSIQIVVTFNLNSPTETPPVNIGDEIESGASVTIAQDAVTENNLAGIKQTVVGSYDPNDKAVNDGATISPEQAGDYLHYVIRFQNTGTAAAEFVRITDQLSAELNLSTLEVTAASHDFRLSLDGNEAEFLFENINLPPTIEDEPGSHGFVAYKIKPAEGFGLGDSVLNTAKIFFDYNFPIITNTVTTTVAMLRISETNTVGFSISPNPANETIVITLENSVDIASIAIFNTLGQLVKSIAPAIVDGQMTTDISSLAQGSYFFKIATNKGTSTQKLVKL